MTGPETGPAKALATAPAQNARHAKRELGQYYTVRNPFGHDAFLAWSRRAGLPLATMIEPFAGANHISRMLRDLNLVGEVRAFDIEPGADDVERRDMLGDYPDIDGVVVTNPPYIARNSATRRGLPFPDTRLPDLYLVCLEHLLARHGYVAAIIPASFLTLGILTERLTTVINLPYGDMFADTDHPVCLALFEPEGCDPVIWSGQTLVGLLGSLHALMLERNGFPLTLRFNDPLGGIGLRAVDGAIGPSIRFVPGEEISPSSIKVSSRAITRIGVEGLDPGLIGRFIQEANRTLDAMRAETADCLLTPFKGVRKDGAFRRRLDFRTARAILSAAAEAMARVETAVPEPGCRAPRIVAADASVRSLQTQRQRPGPMLD